MQYAWVHQTFAEKVNKLVYKKIGIFKLSRDTNRVIKGVHSRDITILIVLATVVYMIAHYFSLFQYFFITLLASLL